MYLCICVCVFSFLLGYWEASLKNKNPILRIWGINIYIYIYQHCPKTLNNHMRAHYWGAVGSPPLPCLAEGFAPRTPLKTGGAPPPRPPGGPKGPREHQALWRVADFCLRQDVRGPKGPKTSCQGRMFGAPWGPRGPLGAPRGSPLILPALFPFVGE